MNWSLLTQPIDDLTMNYGDPFLQIGNGMLFWLGVIILIVYGCKWALSGSNGIIEGFVHFIALYLVAQTMLFYYDSPLPFYGSSFKHLFPDMATYLANTIEGSRYDNAMARIVGIVSRLEHPAWDFWAIMIYVFVELDMIFLGAILLAPIGFGFIALGMGSIVWPLAIPWLIVPRLSFLFWNGLTYMLKYSAYRIWSVMLTYVWAGIMVLFIDHLVFADLPGNQYSIAQFAGMTIIVLVFLNILCAWGIFKLPSLVGDWFNGTANSAAGFLPGALNFLRQS